jgi:hypothetical protein
VGWCGGKLVDMRRGWNCVICPLFCCYLRVITILEVVGEGAG